MNDEIEFKKMDRKKVVNIIMFIAVGFLMIGAALYGKKVGAEMRDDFYLEYIDSECYCPNQLQFEEGYLHYDKTMEEMVENVTPYFIYE